MKTKNILIASILLFALFYTLNLLPIIPVQYNDSLTTEKTCTLNYLMCMSTLSDDNFPSFLKGDFAALLFFPFIAPISFTILILLGLRNKIQNNWKEITLGIFIGYVLSFLLIWSMF